MKKTLYYKHLFFWSFIFLVYISINNYVAEAISDDTTDKSRGDKSFELLGEPIEIKSITIVFDKDAIISPEKGIVVINSKKEIGNVLSMINASSLKVEPQTIEESDEKWSKIIIEDMEGNLKEIYFVFDELYGLGYIKIEQEKVLEPDYDFFRYILSLCSYRNRTADIENQVCKLFNRYGWTVDFKIDTIKIHLPYNLKHRAGEYPVKIYWAYNNELSKEIGLDFSSYLGKKITAEIYRLREPLPDFMHPRKDARGIILKYKNEIIGAYIDTIGEFACALNRKSFKDITKKNWNVWVESYVNCDSFLEKRISKMTPEEVIKLYYEALDNKNFMLAYACLTRRYMVYKLSFMNVDKFSDAIKNPHTTINKVKLLEIKKLKVRNVKNETDNVEYMISAYYDNKEEATPFKDGVYTYFITLEKETQKSGWRITRISTL